MNRRAYRLGVAMVALAMAAALGLRSLAEAAFLAQYGAAWLPYLFVAHAGALAWATLGYDRLTRGGRTAAVDTILLALLAVVAALAPSLLRGGGAAPFAVVLAVVALSSVASLALWNSVAAAVAGRDARRALPRAGAAVTGGGAAAGLVAAAAIKRVGLAPVAYAAAVVVVLVLVIAWRQRAALAAHGAPGGVAAGAAPGPSALSSDQRGIVRWLFAAAVLEAAVATVLEVRFGGELRARWSGADLAVAISLFYGGTNAVLLVLQLAAVPRLLVTRRLPVTASIHPVAIAGAAVGLAAAPGLVAVAIARTGDQVLRAATSRTGQEIALSALPPAPRARWKVLLRGAATPLGTAAMGGALVAVARAGGLGLGALAAVVIALVIAWWLAVLTASRRFLAALATPLGLRGLATAGAVREEFDLRELETRVAAAGASDPRRAAIGRALLARTAFTIDELVRHLDHEDPAVRAALFDLVARAPAASARREVAAAVAIEDDDGALYHGLRAMAALGDPAGLARGRGRAALAETVARAVDAAEVQLGAVPDDVAALRIRALARRDGVWAAAIVRARPALATALADELAAGAVPAECWRAAAGAGDPALAERLLAALAAGEPGTAAAIDELDAAEVEALAAAVAAAHAPVASRAALARARATGAAVGSLLWWLAADPDPEVRGAALKSLVSRVRAGAAAPAARIGPIVDRELDTLDALLAARDRDAADAGELGPAVRRVLDAAAVEAAATGRDPAPLVALGRHLVAASEPARKRALDVVQELARTRPRLLDLVERYLRAPAAPPSAAADLTAAALRATAIFAEAPAGALAALAAAARPIELATGAAPLGADAPGAAMHVVVTGELALPDGTAAAPGDVVGELAVIDASAHPTGAIARAPTRLLAIDRAAFTAAVVRAPEVGLALAGHLARALRTRSR